MKRVILMFLAMFGLVSCTSSQNTYTQMSMNDAMDLMENESDYVILDVRTLEEYNEKHILGAMNIPNESIGTEEIDALPDKEQLIFVYCRSG
ncbi:MAG: rhodanese-like domain-containing protein, partial [Erysipelotrichales bacterium]|nr:rhodanese-like domain-containing protein [Erysipelotrichales bacterium]